MDSNAERLTPEQERILAGQGFVTKDSGKRAEFSTGMVRDTQDGKARFDLLFPLELPYQEQLLTRFAELMARGAEKYAERNWEQARTPEELSRYKASALRHLIQWLTGEVDEDHAAAVIFNLMGAEYVKSRMQAEARVRLANELAEAREKPSMFAGHVPVSKCGVFSREHRGFCIRTLHDHNMDPLGSHLTASGETF